MNIQLTRECVAVEMERERRKGMEKKGEDEEEKVRIGGSMGLQSYRKW